MLFLLYTQYVRFANKFRLLSWTKAQFIQKKKGRQRLSFFFVLDAIT